MREIDRRLVRLETGGQFMSGVAAMSDDDVVGLMAAARNDGPRLSAILASMSHEQLARISYTLEDRARSRLRAC